MQRGRPRGRRVFTSTYSETKAPCGRNALIGGEHVHRLISNFVGTCSRATRFAMLSSIAITAFFPPNDGLRVAGNAQFSVARGNTSTRNIVCWIVSCFRSLSSLVCFLGRLALFMITHAHENVNSARSFRQDRLNFKWNWKLNYMYKGENIDWRSLHCFLRPEVRK